MTARKLASTLLIGLVCGGGLVACGVSTHRQKISDSSFVDNCAARFEKNATLQANSFKAHRFEVCKCIQDKLEAQGFGDRGTGDTSLASEARSAGLTCARQVFGRQKISDPTFVDACAARVAKSRNATLRARRFEVCKCIQARLEAEGYGNRATADTSFEDKARAAGAACARKVLAGK